MVQAIESILHTWASNPQQGRRVRGLEWTHCLRKAWLLTCSILTCVTLPTGPPSPSPRSINPCLQHHQRSVHTSLRDMAFRKSRGVSGETLVTVVVKWSVEVVNSEEAMRDERNQTDFLSELHTTGGWGSGEGDMPRGKMDLGTCVWLIITNTAPCEKISHWQNCSLKTWTIITENRKCQAEIKTQKKKYTNKP